MWSRWSPGRFGCRRPSTPRCACPCHGACSFRTEEPLLRTYRALAVGS
jgi:hypothetical protein